jgi:hypothetical protein
MRRQMFLDKKGEQMDVAINAPLFVRPAN